MPGSLVQDIGSEEFPTKTMRRQTRSQAQGTRKVSGANRKRKADSRNLRASAAQAAEFEDVRQSEEQRAGSSFVPADRFSLQSSVREQASTRELVRQAQAGQDPALDTLFCQYRPSVVDLARRRMGRRLSSKEDPEDLAQTTFREAARDFPRYQYRGRRSFMGWLSRILQNKIRDRAEYYSAAKRDTSKEISLTRIKGKGSDEEFRFDPEATGLTGLDQVEFVEEVELLHEHLEKLSPLHREAIRLVYFEGQSLRQAGRQLNGRSEAAVRMLIRRAAARLQESLDGKLAD